MFYEFKATYWDEYTECEREERGLVFASTYGEAAERVRTDYGRELIGMYLSQWDTAHTISIEEIKKGFKLYS